MSRAIEKYLGAHVDQGFVPTIKNIPYYDFIIVIPAYNESDEFVANILHIAAMAKSPILIVIVVNGPEHACSKTNQDLCKKLLALGPHQQISPSLALISLRGASLALCGPYALPRDQGVGRARKIGADWALRLIDAGKIACPMIFCTDADALLPANYFTAGKQAMLQRPAGLVFPFVHQKPKQQPLNQAITLYEQRLNNYVLGLKKANSPYAFHTIGSTIAVDAQSYAQVRGFPCRPAGEDFYILNKLRKVGAINTVDCEPLILSARVSDRVPFGTGPALSKILHNGSVADAKIFYHPGVFVILGEFLAHAERRILSDQTDLVSTCSSAKALSAFLALGGAQQLERNLNSRKTPKDRLKSFHSWFDAWLTLKFIHHLRDHGLPMCSAAELEELGTPPVA